MLEFERVGYTPAQLETLNHVRLYQQVVFLSDVLCASGKMLDPGTSIRGRTRINGRSYDSQKNDRQKRPSDSGDKHCNRLFQVWVFRTDWAISYTKVTKSGSGEWIELPADSTIFTMRGWMSTPLLVLSSGAGSYSMKRFLP